MSKMTIDTLLAQTLGFNTKSFSESSRMRSKGRLSDGKPYSYGETVRALVTIKSDKHVMIAEAATLKADLVTMKAFKEGSSAIIEKAKDAAKGVWETIKKLIGALIDLIKNFLRKFGSREKQLDDIIKGAEAILARKFDTTKSDNVKNKKFKIPLNDGTVDPTGGAAEIRANLGGAGSRALRNFIIAASKFSVPTKDGLTEFLDALIPGAASADLDLKEFEDKLGLTLTDIKAASKATVKSAKQELKDKVVELEGTAAYEKAKAVLEATLENMRRFREAKPIDQMIKLQKALSAMLVTIKKGVSLHPSDAHLSQKVRVAIPTVTKAITKAVSSIEAEYARSFKVVGITTSVVTAFTAK
jgi:hypothetical protein